MPADAPSCTCSAPSRGGEATYAPWPTAASRLNSSSGKSRGRPDWGEEPARPVDSTRLWGIPSGGAKRVTWNVP